MTKKQFKERLLLLGIIERDTNLLRLIGFYVIFPTEPSAHIVSLVRRHKDKNIINPSEIQRFDTYEEAYKAICDEKETI